MILDTQLVTLKPSYQQSTRDLLEVRSTPTSRRIPRSLCWKAGSAEVLVELTKGTSRRLLRVAASDTALCNVVEALGTDSRVDQRVEEAKGRPASSN